LSHKGRVALIEKEHPTITIGRQAELLEVSRSSIYYAPKWDEVDTEVMNALDEIYMQYPFYGTRRMRWELSDRYGILVNRKRIQRLMRVMGIEAIYPKRKPNTSVSDPSQHKYPYLLTGVNVMRPNQVWGTDITYVRLETGWAYLMAVLDWYSRYVVSWTLSPTLEVEFCIRAISKALAVATPEIHNSDQGSQYTCNEYTSILQRNAIRISMDGRGRCMDNIFTERLWRTVKYENVYLKSYADIDAATTGLSEYFNFYNTGRRHQALDYRTPAQLYFG
jgi:putative transposase